MSLDRSLIFEQIFKITWNIGFDPAISGASVSCPEFPQRSSQEAFFLKMEFLQYADLGNNKLRISLRCFLYVHFE